ncbi:hypothetical protein INT45_004833 [Circinella minor]|uniref:Uncharacterized protein n=1 Tax=Circinella minor TaxID=1195481 RepID=A0A8H7RUL5_9FUNG|nr:hypothetical protein INT45_004833 [Circinella minor]
MPSTITSSNNNSKTFKWASPQRVKSGRVHKRTGSTGSSSSRSSQSSIGSLSKKQPSSSSEIARLESEITFTYDAFATVTVMFDSLQHAYASSKAEMDKSRNATRLSEKEKELLAAYDDLGLQVVHLERQVVKLEKRLMELRSSAPSAPTVAPQPQIQQVPIVPTQQQESIEKQQQFDYMTTPDLTLPSPTSSPIRLGYASNDYFSDVEQQNFYPSPPVSNQPAPIQVQDPTLFCGYSMIPSQQPQPQYIPFDNFVTMPTTTDSYYAACWSMQQPIQF